MLMTLLRRYLSFLIIIPLTKSAKDIHAYIKSSDIQRGVYGPIILPEPSYDANDYEFLINTHHIDTEDLELYRIVEVCVEESDPELGPVIVA